MLSCVSYTLLSIGIYVSAIFINLHSNILIFLINNTFIFTVRQTMTNFVKLILI